MLTDEQKKLRNTANRMRRALLKEKQDFGAISDGSGKRYLVGVYFVLSDAPEKAAEFTEWFEEEFPDDIGEPVFFLYAAMAYYRLDSLSKAQRYLLEVMLSNIYLLPHLFWCPLPRQDMSHLFGWTDPDYVEEVTDLLEEPTNQERDWFRAEFESEFFTNVRNKYIETFRALQHIKEVDERSRLLDEWRDYVSSCRATVRE